MKGNLTERIVAELAERPLTIKKTRKDGKIRGNEKHLSFWADVIVELKADGTYKIIKDENIVFEPRDETVYGIRDARKLKLPEFTVMAGRMDGGIFKGKEI